MEAEEFVELLDTMLPARGLFVDVDELRERAESFAILTIERLGCPDLTMSAIKEAIEAAFVHGRLLALGD
jgi:hypothetical protein